MIEGGSRKRSQPAPPHVLLEALTEPNRDPARQWLVLLADEQLPIVVPTSDATDRNLTGQDVTDQNVTDQDVTDQSARGRAITEPLAVVWTSMWPSRPDALIRFDLPTDGHGGTDLRWTLLLDELLPDDSKLGHLRKRINELINGRLRLSFGQ